jgi:transcriptional regulator with XRE-family HTH domain
MRTAKRIDQTELATRLRRHGLGATQATVSRWENGQEPRAHVLPALAAELSCSIEDLYASEDDEEPDPLSFGVAMQRMFERAVAQAMTDAISDAVTEILARVNQGDRA